jgi:molecular chaperone DnaK
MAVIGIDLGTTNSVGAHYDGKNARTLSPQAGGLVPSQVFFDRDNSQFLVGQAAVDLAYLDPENSILSIKRLMGWNYADQKVTDVRQRVNYAIVHAAGTDDPGVRVVLGGREFTPVEISAKILAQVKQDAEKVIGKVTHAVITVPAYFTERQRAATRKAGEQAGLIVKKIIDEPSAAAIAYGFSILKGDRTTLLVFDLGGGTFDVSIIITAMDPRGKNHFEVLQIGGDNWLGGDDFDREIMSLIVEWTQEKYKVDPSSDRSFQLLAKQAAERAKIALSTANEVSVVLPAAYVHDGRPLNIRFKLTREEFEKRIRPYVDRCIAEVQKVLDQQGYEPDQIDVVLMVGGSTLVPLVYESVENYFGKGRVKQDPAPFHSVAYGAAILAATLKGIQCPNENCLQVNNESAKSCEKCSASLAAAMSVGDISVREPTPRAFGIRAAANGRATVLEVIIPMGEPYPLQEPKSKTFEMMADNSIVIPVFEGDEKLEKEHEWQGDIKITEDDFRQERLDVKAGTKVRVSMNYSRHRELSVRVQVVGTKMDREIRLSRDKPPQGAAPTLGGESLAGELEFLVRAAENFQGKYLAYMENPERKRLDAAVEDAKAALNRSNPIEIRETCDRLALTLNSCGVASTLFLAERVKGGVSPEKLRIIDAVIQKVKTAWGDRHIHRQEFEDLTLGLRAAVSDVMNTRSSQQELPGQQALGSLLRVLGR